MLSRVAIPWVATLLLAATPFEMGILRVAEVAAGAVAALWLGAAVDRMQERSAMLLADVGRALVIGALAAVALHPALGLWMLALAGAIAGVLTVMFELARSAWMARRIAHAQLPARNAQISAATSLSETAAFALGGWLYQGVGAVVALAIDAATYLVSALCVRALPRDDRLPPRTAAQPPAVATLRTGIGDGLRALLATPVLRVLAALELIVALGVSLAGTSYMIYVARDLALPTGVLGLIFATGGAGALLGAALAPRLGRRVGPARAMAVGLVALCIGSACIPLAGGAGVAAVVLLVAHQLIGDGGHVAFEIHERTLRQTRAGADMVARVDASLRTLGYVATLVGALGGGLFATHYGARAALVVCAALFALAALVAALGLKGMRSDAA